MYVNGVDSGLIVLLEATTVDNEAAYINVIMHDKIPPNGSPPIRLITGWHCSNSIQVSATTMTSTKCGIKIRATSGCDAG